MSTRVRALPFALSLTMPAVVALGIAFGGAWVLAATGLVFVLIPVLDALAGHERNNPAPDAPPVPGGDALLWVWLPAQLAMIGAAVWTVGQGELGGLEAVGLAVSLGLVAGAGGINVAHELMHRASPWARAAAEATTEVPAESPTVSPSVALPRPGLDVAEPVPVEQPQP